VIDPSPISASALFLVSGGARGITAECVIALAQRYGCRFLLLGRSVRQPEPAWAYGRDDDSELKRRAAIELQDRGVRPSPAEIQRTIARIRGAREIERTLAAVVTAGGQAEYVAADVSDGEQLAGVLSQARQRLGRISGLIHGAGALADKPIERKTDFDFDRVYSSKVAGLQNLLSCLPAGELQYLLLFASAAGFFGNPGQTDYALSNEILNRVADRVKRAHPACKVVAFNWGPWEAGMVTPQLKQLFAERGVGTIPVRAGTDALIRVIEDPRSPLQVLVGSSMRIEPVRQRRPGRVARLRRQLSLGANPFLADHVVGSYSVLPVACVVGWMCNAAEQLQPAYHCSSVESFRVLKGIVFDESAAGSYVMQLTEVESSEGAIVFEALVSSELPGGAQRYHYRGTITLRRPMPAADIFTNFDLREDGNATAGTNLYKQGILFHGPALQGIERLLNACEERLTVRCRLPVLDELNQGQFPVQTINPYVGDVNFQAIVVWGRLFRNAASLPLSCEMWEQFRPLPFDRTFYVTSEIRAASEYQLLADTTAHDEDGLVFARARGAACTLSVALNGKFVQAAT